MAEEKLIDEIKINGDMIQQLLVDKIITSKLGPHIEKALADAVEKLTGYSSPIKQALDSAINGALKDAAEEMLTSTGMRAKIEKMTIAYMTDELIQQMVERFWEHVNQNKYR